MAKQHLPRKKAATKAAALNSTELLKKCGLEVEAELAGIGTDSKEALGKPAPQLPSSVGTVLVSVQTRLYQVKGIFAGAHALAEVNEGNSDACFAMEAALAMLDSAIDSLDPVIVRREAAKREVSHGR